MEPSLHGQVLPINSLKIWSGAHTDITPEDVLLNPCKDIMFSLGADAVHGVSPQTNTRQACVVCAVAGILQMACMHWLAIPGSKHKLPMRC